MVVAKAYLIDWHDAGQQPFSSLLVSRQISDKLAGRCQEWAADHYADSAPVAAMTRLSGLPERTFVRRFAKATGLSPLDCIHALRFEEAKQMLETGEAPIESISQQMGYEDASFFGRLFRRKVARHPHSIAGASVRSNAPCGSGEAGSRGGRRMIGSRTVRLRPTAMSRTRYRPRSWVVSIHPASW
jgi:transcriptional regulator GlxA family with amidase domain